MDANKNDNKINNKDAEKKNFTEVLSDKAEKAGESYKKVLNSSSKFKMYFINTMLVVYDLFAVALSYFLALWFRFDGEFSQIPPQYLTPYLEFIGFYAVGCIIIFAILKLYRSIWRYASVIEAFRVVMATVITGILHIVFITIFFQRMPLSYYFFGTIF